MDIDLRLHMMSRANARSMAQSTVNGALMYLELYAMQVALFKTNCSP